MPRLSLSDDDPLTVAMLPPAGETPEEALARQRREAEAKRVSDAIDDELREERAAMKKRKRPVKILLLGQAESGAPHCAHPCPHAHTNNAGTRQVDDAEECVC